MARSPFKNFLTRAAVPKAGLGNLLVQPRQGGKNAPIAATSAITWSSPGNPMIFDQDIQAFGEKAYLGNTYVMRCVSAIAQTIAGLEFRAGLDPTQPAIQDPTAPLVQLLGPGTPSAPGGPNPELSSYAFWVWTIAQYIVYGRFAWEAKLNAKQIIGLWPLVAACLAPIPTDGGERFFSSYIYTTPKDGDIPLTYDQCIYAWRMSLQDPRQPETVLSAAKLPIYVAMGLDKYMAKLLENDMVASTLVVTPPFEEASAARAWQEQFLTSFTGVDNRGKTIFAEAEADEDDPQGKPLVQVEKLAQTAVESSMIQLSKEAKIDITIALGVPLSLIGNASQRTYSNADSEYRNFWTITLLPLIKELQEHVNTRLAPRLGMEVGWFDLSKVHALQPPAIFAPPMVGDVIASGVASPEQVANVLQIPSADSTGDEDSDTVEVGEESSQTGAGGTRSIWYGRSRGKRVRWDAPTPAIGHVTKQQLISAYLRYSKRPLNTWTLDQEFNPADWLRRDHIDIVTPSEVIEPRGKQQADALLERVAEVRAIEARRRVTAELVERTVSTANEHLVRGSLQKPHKCRYCAKPASKAIVWAEGAAYVPVCGQAHMDKAVAKIGGQSEVDKVVDLPQQRGFVTVYDRPRVPTAPPVAATDFPDKTEQCKFCDSPATKQIQWAGAEGVVPSCDAHQVMAMEKLGAPNDIDGDVAQQVGDAAKATDIRAAIDVWAGELLDLVQGP